MIKERGQMPKNATATYVQYILRSGGEPITLLNNVRNLDFRFSTPHSFARFGVPQPCLAMSDIDPER
jgi:hypothetical protein